MKRLAIVLCATCLIFAGCGPSFYEVRKDQLLKTVTIKDYGKRPPTDYQEIEKKMILESLKDPDSAKFEWGNVTKDIMPQDGSLDLEPVFVWISSVRVNAKNGFGGYNGFQRCLFAWKNGKLYAIVPLGSDWWEYLK